MEAQDGYDNPTFVNSTSSIDLNKMNQSEQRFMRTDSNDSISQMVHYSDNQLSIVGE